MDTSRGDNVQGILGAIGPFWAKWGLGRVQRSPRFCVWFFGNFATADFHQIWSQNTVRCFKAESGKTFSKIFTLGVISQTNLKSKIRQTGTSLRAGYSSWDVLQRYCLLHVVVQGPGSFRGQVNVSLRRTLAELRGIAQFSDFGLFPYTKPLKRTFR